MKRSMHLLLLLIICFTSCQNDDKKNKNTEAKIANTDKTGIDQVQNKKNEQTAETNNLDVDVKADDQLSPENKIQFYREHENYRMAISLVDSLISQDNNNSRLWSIKGMMHFENEDTTKAISAFEKSISIFPSAEDNLNLAMLYAGKGNQKAIKIADELSKSGKGTLIPKLNFVRGTYFNKIGKKEEAIKFFDQAIRDNYTFMDAYREKALILSDLKRYPEAVNTLIRAVTLQNNYEDGYYYLGQCYEKMGDINKAVESYQTALMYNPQDKEASECLNRLSNQ